MINVESVQVTELATNCYIVTDEVTGDCAVIDPGEFSPKLDKALSKIGYDKIKLVLLTHGHYDHIGGTNDLLAKTNNKAEVAISENDVPLLSNSFLNLSKFFTAKPLEDIKSDIALHDGDKITLGESVFTVISTPGHTSGSVCFVCDDKIFSGDTLFYRSHGRTDFPTGDEKAMLDSLNKLANLSGNYTVYPGHDMSTTLDSERKYNPYIGNNFYDNIY